MDKETVKRLADKRQAALDAIKIAQDVGVYPEIEGNWVIWRPCLPANLLHIVLGHGDEIVKILSERRA